MVFRWNRTPSGALSALSRLDPQQLDVFLCHIRRQIPGPAIASSLFQPSFRVDLFTADITRRVQPLDPQAQSDAGSYIDWYIIYCV